MDSIKYLLTKFSRINNLRKEDYPFGFGNLGLTTDKPTAFSVIGYKNGAESYRGTNEVNYNRLDLTTLFKNVTPVLTMFQPKNHREIFRELLWVYGLPGANEDAVLDEVTNTAVDWRNPPTEVEISVAKGNLYAGKLKINIVPKVMPLDEIVVVREFPLMVDRFPINVATLVGERWCYHYDFTFSPEIASLRAAAVGSSVGSGSGPNFWYVRLLNDPDVKQECSDINWVNDWMSPGGQFNLYGAKVLYNGPARNYPDANPEYKYVAVFGVCGRLLLHYN